MTRARKQASPPILPAEGGSWVRMPDGSLVREQDAEPVKSDASAPAGGNDRPAVTEGG